MKNKIGSTITLLVTISVVLASRSMFGDTLYGPGTITIATNEVIIITSMHVAGDFYHPTLYLDGNTNNDVNPADNGSVDNSCSPRYAIAGPHTLTAATTSGDQPWITFQRLNGSAIGTIVAKEGTNTIDIPAGKTIQFFSALGSGSINDLAVKVQPLGSTNIYRCYGYREYPSPSFTGPATVQVFAQNPLYDTYIVSYYFTDDIVQLPPAGLLAMPAPYSEVDIEKSQNLVDWTLVGAFHTTDDPTAFYRLHILK